MEMTKDTFVVFVHGFTGDGVGTWGGFKELLSQDAELGNCEFRFWDYPTEIGRNNFRIIEKLFWEDDPNIETISGGLRTMLNFEASSFKKIVLLGHSMGGLVIQKFIIEEILNNETKHLSRLTEVALFGTPSGGLKTAWFGSWFKNQIANMSVFGAFINTLRADWKRLIDDRRSFQKSPAQFRLTVSAGMKDNFVPQWSSLDPFPLDEKEILPGNHVELIKTQAASDLVYRLIKERLMRGTLTAEEWARINGQSQEIGQLISQINAAVELSLIDDLEQLANKLLATEAVKFPQVERRLGLALLGAEHYGKARDLLQRYLNYKMPDGAHPFSGDAQAVQQLAIALSELNDFVGAVTLLKQLPPELANAPETRGILGGRYKRRWRKDESLVQIGNLALRQYEAALASAKNRNEPDQVFYNGINVAYLDFALEGQKYGAVAEEVLTVCQNLPHPDYWSEATRAEALLLLKRYPEAAQAYQDARRMIQEKRQWTSTGEQARDILRRQKNPPEAQAVANLFASANS